MYMARLKFVYWDKRRAQSPSGGKGDGFIFTRNMQAVSTSGGK